MYYDSERNAYIDRDTGEVVFQENADESFESNLNSLPITENSLRSHRSNQYRHFAQDEDHTGDTPRSNRSRGSRGSRGNRSNATASTQNRSTASMFGNFFFPKASSPSAATANETSYYSNARFASPRSLNTSHNQLPYIDDVNASGIELGHIDIGNEVIMEGGREDQKTSLAEDLYNIHMNNSYDIVEPTSNERSANPNGWDDWTLARALQALEFEIPEETNAFEDFHNKEYNASKSCRRQLLTISFFICLVQIGLMIAMFQIDGTASQSENSAIGPPAYSMVRFGAKESALIVYKDEYWRLLSSIMLHAGVIHIVPNVLIQLRIGGYLNLVYGTWKWMWIYFISGIFGEILSCLFIPDAVGVGSSGALMGLLGSWVTWILMRWNKIPPECRSQRNCQLFTVVTAIVVTLATSFMPAVDWAAHAGGAFQGILWGVVLLGSEMEQGHKQQVGRFFAAVIAVTTYAYAIYYLVVDLKPSSSSLSYWAQNDDWHR